MDQSIKKDANKARWDLMPFDALEEIARVRTFGTEVKNYGPESWKRVEIERYEAALMRHLTARKRGEMIDDESGLLHAAHMACNAMFILWLEMQKLEERMPKPEERMPMTFVFGEDDVPLPKYPFLKREIGARCNYMNFYVGGKDCQKCDYFYSIGPLNADYIFCEGN